METYWCSSMYNALETRNTVWRRLPDFVYPRAPVAMPKPFRKAWQRAFSMPCVCSGALCLYQLPMLSWTLQLLWALCWQHPANRKIKLSHVLLFLIMTRFSAFAANSH